MESKRNESREMLLRFDAAPSDDIKELAARIRASDGDVVRHSLGLYLLIANAFMRDPKSCVIIEDSSGKLSEIIGSGLDILRSQKRE